MLLSPDEYLCAGNSQDSHYITKCNLSLHHGCSHTDRVAAVAATTTIITEEDPLGTGRTVLIDTEGKEAAAAAAGDTAPIDLHKLLSCGRKRNMINLVSSRPYSVSAMIFISQWLDIVRLCECNDSHREH